MQCKKPTPTPWPCFSKDQNFTNNFWKGHQMNISLKLFWNLTTGFRGEFFKEFLMRFHLVAMATIVFWNQILWTTFEEDLTRNILLLSLVQIGLAILRRRLK